MIYSKDGLHITEQFECCKLTAYEDEGGTWTIGWGHTGGVKQGDTCNQALADFWLACDLKGAEQCVNTSVHVFLTQNEFDALVDFVYNLGCAAFRNSTLLRMLNAGNYHGAADQFDCWHYVAGKQCAGLLRRRKAETAEFEREGAD